MDQKAAVAYPTGEDPFTTRDRVKTKERYNDEWRFYMAEVKYESDSYSDAEYWIATRNDYGPLVKEEPEITLKKQRSWGISDAPPRFTLNKKLRSANQSHSSQSNDNLQKPLPRNSTKRIALAEPKEQLDEKRLKLGEAAQPSSTVARPGCSKREQPIIIQHNQSKESAHTKVAAAASNGESSSSQHIDENFQPLPMQEQQELSMPAPDMDIPTVVIDSNGEVHVNRIKNKQLPSDQVFSQFAQQPEPVEEPQISFAPSMTSNRQEHRTDHNSNNELASHHLLNSLKMSNHLYSHMDGARRLVPIQKPIKKRLFPINIPRNMTIATQNPSNLMDQTALTRSVEESSVVTYNQSQNSQVREMLIGNSRDQTVPTGQNVTAVGQRNVFQNVTNVASAFENCPSSSHKRSSFARQLDGHQSSLVQEQYLTRSHQNQYLPTNQDNFEQEVLRRSTDSYGYDHRPMRTSSVRQNLSHSVDPLYEKTSELSQERQSQRNQQDSQWQQQRPKICIDISVKPKNMRRTMPTLEGVTKKTRLQASESVLYNENHLNVMDKACQTDQCMVKETMPPYQTVNSDSDALMDHEEISNLDMSPTDEAHIKTGNNFYRTGTASGRMVVDRPSDAQNSKSANQRPSRLVLEQQMLDHFSTLFTQMGSTLRYTCDMYNNLRSSILETAETYKQMLKAVEQFNTLKK